MGRVKFTVNGKKCSVGGEVTSDFTLLDYIRESLELRGTKYMCREGGCGACIVSAVTNNGNTTLAVNSCLVSITSCQGWEITTVEKVGNRLEGYSKIQTTLAKENGTQCGYCTPGWIMAMYSLLQSKKNTMTMLEIENSFASNICRCTGYRPILTAFKKFAKDAPDNILADIEDVTLCQKNCSKPCNNEDKEWCIITDSDINEPKRIEIKLKDGKMWYKAQNISDIFKIFKSIGNENYMLVAGNTAKGVYPISEYPPKLIDISDVTELKSYILDQNLVVGAGTTLTEFLDIMKHFSEKGDFKYLNEFYTHINLVAHIAVRNIGTIAGNLMIKYLHNDFPSDLFLLFKTVGAQLTIVDKEGSKKTYTMNKFLTLDMNKRIILNVMLPPLSRNYKIATYKIMPRAQNAHAIVNAGFQYNLNNSNKVVNVKIVYGGLKSPYSRAKGTEKFLKEKHLFDNATIQGALNILDKELIVNENPPEPSVEYRKRLALALFYKSLLKLCPKETLDKRFVSGAINIHETRPVSSGSQTYNTDPLLYPLNQPVEKVEALIQCAGEAPYTEDLAKLPREVFAAFVLSTVASGKIVSIDPSIALAQTGVITFYTAKDIPGLNYFHSGFFFMDFVNNEEILADGKVKFYNQPIGIIVADTYDIAQRASKLVKITYTEVTKPVIELRDAIKNPERIQLYQHNPAMERGNNIIKIIKGTSNKYEQYHFSMETLAVVTRPTEEGMEIHTTTQWADGAQTAMSKVLNIDENKIDIYTRRLGGAFGIKLSRVHQMTMACGLVTYKLNRPCRFITPLTTVMRAVGKRLPMYSEYEVAVDGQGAIQYINLNSYSDYGHIINENIINNISTEASNNCYKKQRWDYKSYMVTTDSPKNTWCRAPGNTTILENIKGTLEAIAEAEWIMERISYELSIDSVKVRLANLDAKYESAMTDVINKIKINSEYTKRKSMADQYNKNNRWKKRGLKLSLTRWTPQGFLTSEVTLSVYQGDGSVSIVHGASEMGQGVNTKAVQICAYLLKIPMSKVQVKGNNSIIAPNSSLSGGSLTSQNVGVGIRNCCIELLTRLEPIKKQMENATWKEIVAKAYESGVDLQCHSYINNTVLNDYDIFSAVVTEVELDVLTGETEILRVDILQDVGQSVSPSIDIGQIEGAFVMGIGHWTKEKIDYNKDTGEVLTDRTWNYYVPQAKDIPQDMRIYFRENSFSKDIFFGSKGIGEPPMCLAVSVPIAIREAIVAARVESGIPSTEWFDIDAPYTIDKVCLAAAPKLEAFKFN